jgi:hypothetical protein
VAKPKKKKLPEKKINRKEINRIIDEQIAQNHEALLALAKK